MSDTTLRLQVQMPIGTSKGRDTNKCFGRDVAQVCPDIDTTFTCLSHFRHQTDAYAFCQSFRFKVLDIPAETFGQQVVIQYEITDVLKVGTRNTDVPATLVIELN